MKPDVAIISPVPVPEGGAAARRILGVEKSLAAAGLVVAIGSGGRKETAEPIPANVARLGERRFEHLPQPIKRAAYFTAGRRAMDWLNAMPAPPGAIVLYSGYTPYLRRLIPWCRARGVRLIFDAVEWYGNSAWQVARSPYLLNTELAMRVLVPKCDGVIAISSYLARYYAGRGVPVFRMPPTLQVSDLPAQRTENDRLTLSYSGTPGGKDRLDLMLEAVLRFDPRGERVVFRVAGVKQEDLLKLSPLARRKLEQLPHCIEALGVISGDRARTVAAQSDFTMLLRDENRVSRAGFPTKVVESLSAGTPVIATPTGDLSEYLVDGLNGLRCSEASAESLCQAIQRAAQLGRDELARMRESTRSLAREAFDFAIYSEALADFVTGAGRR